MPFTTIKGSDGIDGGSGKGKVNKESRSRIKIKSQDKESSRKGSRQKSFDKESRPPPSEGRRPVCIYVSDKKKLLRML